MKIKSANTETQEAEERYAAEAKLVEAQDFHSWGAGSNPVGSTIIF